MNSPLSLKDTVDAIRNVLHSSNDVALGVSTLIEQERRANRNTDKPGHEACLFAIKARIQGDWDHPFLDDLGPLSTSIKDDLDALLALYDNDAWQGVLAFVHHIEWDHKALEKTHQTHKLPDRLYVSTVLIDTDNEANLDDAVAKQIAYQTGVPRQYFSASIESWEINSLEKDAIDRPGTLSPAEDGMTARYASPIGSDGP